MVRAWAKAVCKIVICLLSDNCIIFVRKPFTYALGKNPGHIDMKQKIFSLKTNAMIGNNNTNDRPESYPKPTETDAQLKNQDEYTERQSASRSEDMPVHGGKEQNNEPERKREERRDLL